MNETAYQGLLNAARTGVLGIDTTAVRQAEYNAYNNAMQNAQIQNAQIQNSAAIQNTGAIVSGMGVSGLGGYTYGGGAQPIVPVPIYAIPQGNILKDPNRIASMTMPLTALVDLWRVKWGDTWLHDRQLPPAEDLDLWSMAAVRLHANSKFEIVASYFRLREDA